MDDEENGGLFNIEVSSSDESVDESEKVPRDFQSEVDFQRVKETWRPKIEVGELRRALYLPIDDPSKQESQVILHSIEELYFMRKYEEANTITKKALGGKLSGELRKTIEDYKIRCETKLKKQSSMAAVE
ncbi:hypothetical protein BGZ60DRAFT_365504 [Tricladium varicosporioides]|nr:hypothetical protein BGZ60DRAFT_365504 [Hymenoscyphus varicosporioides]